MSEPTWKDAVVKDPRLLAFNTSSREDKAKIVCAMHGHAAVETGCFGYWHCDRCGDQVGDSLGGGHTPPVIRGHDCFQCQKAWEDAGFWAQLGVRPGGGGFLQREA